MNTTPVTGSVIFSLFLIISLCIPVSAYSADATGSYNSGRALTESGNYPGAVAAYNSAVTLEPSYFEAWDGLADVLNRNGQFNDALAASNRSLDINSGYVQGWINRGQILYNIGYWYENVANDTVTANARYTEQLHAFDKAIDLDPNNAEAWFNKGYALAGMQRYDEAIAAFDRVMVIDPTYPKLRQNRQIALQLRNKVAGSPVTTVPPPAPGTTLPGSSGQPATAPSTQASPLGVVAGVVGILGAVLIIVQRK